MTLFNTTTRTVTHENTTYRVVSGTTYPDYSHPGWPAHKIYQGRRLMGGYEETGNRMTAPMEAKHDDWLCSGTCREIVTGEETLYC